MKKIFGVYDKVGGIYTTVFQHMGRGTAFREFQDVVLKEGSIFRQHPGDYVLNELASFDEESGAIVPLSPPTKVVSVMELLEVEKKA